MNIDFEKEIKNLRAICLTAEEKEKMGSAILNRPTPLKMFWFWPKLAAPVALLFIVAGSLGFSSLRSLPGDSLYKIKLAAENISEVFAWSREAKAEAKISQAVRRLEEAEALLAQGRLDQEKETELGQAFEKISDDSLSRITVLKDMADPEVHEDMTASFEGRLEAYSEILGSGETVQLEAEAEVETETLVQPEKSPGLPEKLPKKVENFLSRLRENSQSPERAQREASQESAENSRKSAGEKIQDVEQTVNKLSEKYQQKITDKLNFAKVFYEEGERNITDEDYNQAYLLFRQASKKATEAKAQAESYISHDLND